MAKLPTLLDFSLFGHLFIWDTLSLDYIPHWECSALTRRETRYEEDDFVLLGSRSWKQRVSYKEIFLTKICSVQITLKQTSFIKIKGSPYKKSSMQTVSWWRIFNQHFFSIWTKSKHFPRPIFPSKALVIKISCRSLVAIYYKCPRQN